MSNKKKLTTEEIKKISKLKMAKDKALKDNKVIFK